MSAVKWVALLMFGGVGLIAFIAGCVWGYQRFMLYRDAVRRSWLR